MTKKQHDLGRRRFVKGVGAASIAGLAGPRLIGEARASETEWSESYDLVIIGSGFAGLAAGIEARQNGLERVAIFEKMPYFGGNSAINGGLFAAPGTPLQAKEGVDDSVDKMVADQLLSGRGVAYEGLLRHVASNAAEALKMCEDAGAEFHPYLQQLGGHSVPRTYQTTVSCGAGITQPLYRKCQELGVLMRNRCLFEKFIQDDSGRVVGVKLATRYYYDRKIGEGKTINVNATRGVLIATGGFSQNIALRSAQDPTLTAEVTSTNAPGATGEAMLEMFRLGAVPVHLAYIQSGPWASPDEGGFGYVSNYSIYNFPHSVAINRSTGRRFMNEIADRKTRADAELANRDEQGEPLPPILITSYTEAIKHPSAKKVLRYDVGWKFDDLASLAKKFQVPLEPLTAQIAEYNGYVRDGEDKQFGKSLETATGKLIEAPFMVVRLWPKVHYCQGGVEVNVRAEVIDSSNGVAIPGLYAAGEVTGGIHGVSRLGSCSIPECLVMGITAARSVAGGTA
ncbi:MAG: flavocytochrome c [Woeseiaceae bacterium]